MEFVQNDGIRPQRHERLLRKPQELCVGHELHIGKLLFRIPLLVFEDIIVGRQPQEPVARMILDEPEARKLFPAPVG